MGSLCLAAGLISILFAPSVLSICPNNCNGGGTCDNTDPAGPVCKCDLERIGVGCEEYTFKVETDGLDKYTNPINYNSKPAKYFEYFKFKLKSCRKGLLNLKTVDGATFEIRIGGSGVTSTITMLPDAAVDLTSIPLIECNKYRTFWVDWANGQIRLGKGSSKGDNVVLAQKVSTPLELEKIQVTTTDGEAGSWLFPVSAKSCVPRISIDFSDDKIENKSPRKVYIYNEDVKITSSGRKGVAYGTFNGRTSQIESARNNGVQFPKLLVRMRFYSDDRYGAPYQVLFSDCESTAKPWDIRELKPDENPSVAIILSKDEGRLTFLGYSEDKRVKPAIIRLDYSKKNWNNVELMYDGASFNARVRSVNPDGTIAEKKDSKPLTGKLATSRQPIRIGKCSKSNAFYGFIDVIKMFDCIPN